MQSSSSARSGLPALTVAAALTILSFYLHVQNFRHAGALWRDEVNTVELASEATFSSIYANLHFDSFPLLWVTLLRSYTRLGGQSDAALRGLGLVVGTLGIAVLWMNARMFPHRVPALSLLLIGVNAAIIRYGDSLRAYGTGILTGLLMFGAIWNLTRRADWRTLLLATIASLLAVHSLFYNAVFLFASCMGGIAVMLRRRDRRGMVTFLSIGAICALSLVLYVPMFQGNRAWSDLVRYDVGPSWFWSQWKSALEMNGESMRFLWTTLFILACFSAIATLRRKPDAGDPKKEVALFCLTTLLVGTLSYAGFLSSLDYLTAPWYYLTLMVLIASCLDPLLGLLSRRKQQLTVSAALAVLAGLAVEPVLVVVRSQQTNIDLIAQKISNEASPHDMVFVFPWQAGISFQRYYRGTAEWQTVPPMTFHRWHRYDLFKDVMSNPGSLERFLADVEQRLARGGRVWVVAPAVPHETLNSQPRARLEANDHVWRKRLSILVDRMLPRKQLFRLGSVGGGFENLLIEISIPETNSPPEDEIRTAPAAP